MTTSYIPPYVSVGEFVKFMDKLRSRKPEWLTVKALREIGFSESNSYTLRSSLIKMGIYDEAEGKLLQREDLIGLASRDENIRQETFKRILERTYPDLIAALPIEEATVEKVKHYFEVNGVATGPALKSARLFIWFAGQAGFETAEVEFTPYNLEQEKVSKQKDNKKTLRNDGAGKSKNKENETVLRNSAKNQDYEEQLLNILLEKIRATDTLPSAEILQQVRELIEIQKQKSKSQHASSIAELPVSKENGDA